MRKPLVLGSLGLLLFVWLSAGASVSLYGDSFTSTIAILGPGNATGAFDGAVAQNGEELKGNDVLTWTISNLTVQGTPVDVSFRVRMNASAWINDNLTIQYSNDSGGTWISVQTASPPPTLTTYGNFSVGASFPARQSIDNMNVRILYVQNQGRDRGTVGFDGVEVLVTYQPVLVSLGTPENDTYVSAAVFNFTPSSARPFSNCTLYLNGTQGATNQTIANGTQNFIATTLADGQYDWNVTCIDSTGASGTAATARVLFVDATAPGVTLLSPSNSTLNKTSGNITFVYGAADVSPLSSCSLVLNGQVNETALGDLRGGGNFTVFLENGQYNWTVQCVDAAGNVGTSGAYNVTVDVAPPVVNAIDITQGVVLNAGTIDVVECNASVTDTDGFANILGANATFYASAAGPNGSNDPSVRYTNDSCIVTGSFGNEKNFSCSLAIWYFAVNGTWSCNVTIQDAEGLVGSHANSTVVDPLYALNVTETLMDFGDVEAGVASANVTQNVSNIGNQEINVTVYGYGKALGDGNAFGCEIENISVGSVRYAANSSADFFEKEQLDSSPKQLRMTIGRQTQLGEVSQNSTYWQVLAPKNVTDIGQCNGTIVFQAELG